MAAEDPTMGWPARAGFETRTVQARDGTRLRVLLAGPKTAPRAVFAHGFPQNAAIWRKTVGALGGAVRAVLVDLRGYAGSELSASGRYDLDTLAGDLERVLEETAGEGAPGSAVLVGHDWGGAIAWEIAARRADLVRHLVAVNSPHRSAYLRELRKNPKQRRASWYMAVFQLLLLEHLLASSGAAFFARALRRSARQGTFSDEDIEILVAPLRDPRRVGAALSYYGDSRRELARDPSKLRDDRQVSVPTTILWGRRDVALLPTLAERIVADHAAHATIRWLEDATHWVPDEEPGAVARAVLDAVGGPAQRGETSWPFARPPATSRSSRGD
jgi:pimeloyl-ACP methyl ester carboxylesterase